MFNHSDLGNNTSSVKFPSFYRSNHTGYAPRTSAPPGFSHPPPLLNTKFDSFDTFGFQNNNSADLSARMFYQFYHDPVFPNQAYYWSQWNQMSALATEAQRLRALTFSLTSLSNREHNPALMKTKICDHWRRSGSCSYGDSCWYAHGEDDLRKINLSRNHRTIEEKTGGESDRSFPHGSIYRGLDLSTEEAKKLVKPVDEIRISPPPKRASTNVKGLTVNIPSNIAAKESSVNDSMPLSPAQERWISMSVGGNIIPPPIAADKVNEGLISSNSSITAKNCFESEFEKKLSMEGMFERKPTTGKFLREDEIDDYGFLSPNPFPYPQASAFSNGVSSQNVALHPHHRSFSRGHQPKNYSVNQFGGVPSQQSMMSGQEQARLSRSGNVNVNYFDHPILPTQKSNSSTRSSREIGQAPVPNAHQPPQIQQAIWNVAGEIYQRQKDIESVGLRGSADQYNMQPKETEMGRLLAKLKSKDLSCLRFMVEQGMLSERDMPRQTWNELINSGSSSGHPAPQMPTQFYSNNSGVPSNDQTGSDCSCKNSRSKSSFEASVNPSHFSQPHHDHQAHHFSQHPQQYYPHSQQQQQSHRHQGSSPFGGTVAAAFELAAPPKIFESLLPSDENFSMWLDPKPKKETGGYIRASHGIEHSNSGASLLAKMEVLRSEKCPISEEEMLSSSGTKKISQNNRRNNSESSSPPVLSLIELLSNDNLLEKTYENKKTTMFDFDTLKIAETLQSAAASAQSSQTSSSKSPRLFFVDEQTPSLDDYCSKPSELYTPLSGQTPSFMEQCDFFAAGGSCPFGDGCQLSHATPRDKQQQLEAL
ncbi:unnamed protein product [Caenorhabditis brenneri]